MKKMKRPLALLLSAVLFVNAFVIVGSHLDVNASNEFVPIVYEDAFDYEEFQGATLYDSGIWVAESPETNGTYTGRKPIVEDGVLKFQKGMSAQLLWKKIEGFTFDSAKTYTLTFDVTVTDFGDDAGFADNHKRELYVAPGGWFNQVELRSDNGSNCIRTGGNYCGTRDNEYKENTPYTVIIEWQPSAKTVTSTLKDGDTIVSTGSRTSDDYTHADSYFTNWVIRCEDGTIEIDNLTYTDGTNTYEEKFEYKPGESYMASSGIWDVESVEKSDAKAPEIIDGVVKFSEENSIVFNWTKVPGIDGYDPQNSYIFEFDMKVTDAGDGSTWGNADQTRALYVAMGGYYNQIEIPTRNNQVRAGDVYQDVTDAYINKTLRARLVWEGSTITSSLYDESGKLLTAGSRTSTSYTSITDHRAAMTYLALRCEDGAVEIDNFAFRVERFEKAGSTALEIEEGKSAVYEAKVKSEAGIKATLKLNNTEFFSIADGILRLCGSMVGGNYGAGDYGVKATINKDQKMVIVEVTLPDGGIVRRGTYAVIDMNASEYAVDLYTTDASKVSDIEVSYKDNTENEYELTTVEPTYEGFGANVFNLVSSFSDARTTRSFAWTAFESYIGKSAMAVKYRVKGESEWMVADAIAEDEEIRVPNKCNYYKVDIEGLKAGTEYEYKIGKKDGTDENADWSKTYTFKTAPENVAEFSFVAVGDTQGVSWNGTTVATKGYMFANAAYEQAMKEVGDAAFILHTGDVTENGADTNQWNLFFKALGEIGATTPHFAAIGNHDVVSISGRAPEFYFDLHFNHPNNGGTDKLDKTQIDQISGANANLKDLAANADETFYSYNYGDVHFIVLNTGNYSGDDKYIIEAQREWLEEDLKANTCAKWTIITLHEPVYHRLGGGESRPWLYDLIEKYGVDLLIQGHSHLVTRTYPMKDGKIVSKENIDVIKQGTGTVYTTIGSTTYNHDSMGNPNVEECAVIATPTAEQATYTVVKVSGDSLTMTIKQLDGLVVDSFTITADAEKPEHTGTEEVVGKKDATCAEEGYTGDTVCSACKEIIKKGESIAATGVHTFGDWTVTKEATETEKGEKVRKCSVCSYEEKEEIPMIQGTQTTTQTPDTTQTPGTTDDNTSGGKSGCKSVIGFGAVAILTAAAAAVALKKKD